MTTAGNPVVCEIKTGQRQARWRSPDGGRAARPAAPRVKPTILQMNRRQLLAAAKNAGVTVRRGEPDDQVRAKLGIAQATAAPVITSEPVKEQPVPEPTTPPIPPVVDVTRRTTRRPAPNDWGGARAEGHMMFHGDGKTGLTVDMLGGDALIDMGDGEPLADTLGNIASDVCTQTISPQEGLDRTRAVAARLPEGSRARALVDRLVSELDAPATPEPELPDGTPARLVDLVRQLHAIPACRQPGAQELIRAVGAAHVAAARRPVFRVENALREIVSCRHESDSDRGKQQIDRLVAKTLAGLRADRAPLP